MDPRIEIELTAEDIFRPNLAATIDDTRTWVDPRGYRLSDRLWRTAASDRAQIDAILQAGVHKGQSPLQTSRQLESMLNPYYQPRRDPDTFRILPKSKQPKGVVTTTPRTGPGRGAERPGNSGLGSYAARRLARTETTRAFGASSLKSSYLNPLIERMKWRLSGHHKRADVCNRNARDSSPGQPAGVYALEDVPGYPAHPHEMCTISPYVTQDDIDDAIPRLRRAMQDGDFSRAGLARPLETATPVAKLTPLQRTTQAAREDLLDATGAMDKYLPFEDEYKAATSRAEKAVRKAGAAVRRDTLKNLAPDQREALQQLTAARKAKAAFDKEFAATWKQMQAADDDAFPALREKWYRMRDQDQGFITHDLKFAEARVTNLVDADSYKRAVQDSLRKVRGMGSDLDHPISPNSDQRAIDAFHNHARRDLPTEWWETSIKRGPLRFEDQGPDGRGVYRQRTTGDEIAVGGSDSYVAELSSHELTHRMEYLRPEIGFAEQGFYARRTKGEEARWLGAPYREDELYRPDEFPDPYMGKDYGRGSSWEIATMGIQDVMRGSLGGRRGTPEWLINDDDLQDFVLGILAIG
jgi:hypothetical protein